MKSEDNFRIYLQTILIEMYLLLVGGKMLLVLLSTHIEPKFD